MNNDPTDQPEPPNNTPRSTSTALDQVNAARKNAIAVLEDLEQLATAYELPYPAEELRALKRKLRENSYNVLVVGEAKRGKSTFVNAVIGRDLLPTDVDIATSQVFRVRRSEKEAYRLRFEDDSARQIEPQDLSRYGSQVAADFDDIPPLDQIIRWVEVDVPVKFLPPEITLIDTPGLGSLYATHTQITQRYMPLADGVIFVLGSNHPISEPEVDFLSRLLDVTDQVFFIQTMIDQHRRDAWESVRQRNEAILADKFAGRLTSCKVWPISSANLREAAKTGDDDYLQVSRFPQLAVALQKFLFRSSGWSSIAKAVMLSGSIVAQGRQILSDRRESLLEESAKRRQALRDEAMTRRRQFEQDWGRNGQLRQDLQQAVVRHTKIGRQAFEQALHPTTGVIAKQFLDRIDSIKSLTEANEMAKTLNDDVVAAAGKQWREICESTYDLVSRELAPFVEELYTTNAKAADDWDGKFDGMPRLPAIEAQYFERLRNAVTSMGVASTTAYVSLNVATLAIPIAGPLAVGAMVLAAAAGATRGAVSTRSKELRESQAKLRSHLSHLLQHIHQRFHAVDQATGRFSIVEEYFQNLVRTTLEKVESLVNDKQSQLQSDLQRLDEQLRMTDEQRKKNADVLSGQIQKMTALARRVDLISGHLESANEAISAAGNC
ncbi:MAG: hypothetical protein KatS3mg105_5176 [Gemmatales bacterium]|nr:MAG: hypothetical protein KatS3mg105_5176 [Gemmatales bacterium]